MGISLPWLSNYPASIDDRITNFPVVSDNVHDVLASHVNELADATVALQNVLGGLRLTPIDPGLTPNDGDILVYNSVSSRWESASPASALSFPILAPDGTLAAPSYSFSGDTNMGILRSSPFFVIADNNIAMLLLRANIDASGDLNGATFSTDINQPGTPAVGWTALKLNVSATSDTGTGAKNMIEAEAPAGIVFRVDNTGRAYTTGGSDALPAYSRLTQTDSGLSIQPTHTSLSFGAVGIARARASAFDIALAGSSGTPSLVFAADLNTGLFQPAVDQVGLSCGGTNAHRWTATQSLAGVAGSVGTPGFSLIADPNTGLFWPADDTLAVAVGGAEAVRWTSTPQELLPNGSAASPSLAFASDLNSGLYRVAEDQLGVALGGALTHTFTATQILGPAGATGTPAFSFAGDPDTGIWNAAANQVGIACTGVTRFTVSSGNVTSTVEYIGPTGAASSVTYGFSSDTNTGMYRVAADNLGFSAGGTLRLNITTAVISAALPILITDGTSAVPSLAFSAATGTGIYRDTLGEMGFSVGGNTTLEIEYSRTISSGSYFHADWSGDDTGVTGSAGWTMQRWSTANQGSGSGAMTILQVVVGASTSLSITHLGGTNGSAIKAGDGTATGNFAYSFVSDTDLGIYRFAGNTLGIGADAGVVPRLDNVTALGHSVFLGQASDQRFSDVVTVKSTLGGGTTSDPVQTTTAQVQTTDATQTTLATATLANNKVYWLEAKVIARDTAGTERAFYVIRTRVHRQGGGGATLGTVNADFTDESTAGLDATFTVSSNDVRVSVTGIVATTINWACELYIQGTA